MQAVTKNILKKTGDKYE